MGAIEDHFVKAQAITEELMSRDLFDFIKTVSDYMVALNRDQIQNKSQDIYGDAIGFYSRATEVITGGRKKAGEPFDGNDTGSWLSKFYVSIQSDYFFFGSTDPKTDDILSSEHWLSHDLFGLTEENLQVVIDEKILPFVIAQSRKYLDL